MQLHQLLIVYSCSDATMADTEYLQQDHVVHKAENIYYLTL